VCSSSWVHHWVLVRGVCADLPRLLHDLLLSAVQLVGLLLPILHEASLDVLLVVCEPLDCSVKFIFLKAELLMLLTYNLVENLLFKPVHGLLEQDEESARVVQLVDELVALLEELGADQILHVLGSIVESSLHVRDLLIFDVDQPPIVVFLLAKGVRP